jgi:hypothetical protein
VHDTRNNHEPAPPACVGLNDGLGGICAALLRFKDLFAAIFVSQLQGSCCSLGLEYHVGVLRAGWAGKA